MWLKIGFLLLSTVSIVLEYNFKLLVLYLNVAVLCHFLVIQQVNKTQDRLIKDDTF